ncbi:class II aldolase/adducin family protein [Clostridium sediminicola]|uniref:class II aldolase/adducin family protein n=1 Tax=Clostridium sediminicola TaxID=3114879 RepID=UPI0031F2228C
MLKELREEVLEVAKKLTRYNLVVLAGGTVCARDKESGYIAITGSGMDYDDMTWEDVCIIDIDLNIIDGGRRISVASDMFTEIMKARPDVGAVIHTHSRYATAFATLGKEIPVVTTTQANLVGGSVPVVTPIHPGPHTPEYLNNIVDTLGTGMACNLENHGPVVVGKDLKECLEVAVTIEVTAHVASIAYQMGQPYILNPEQAKLAYEYCKKSVGQ